MRFGKEYPATHSMATSWFGIDEDGNVALIQFEDNGPVPFDCRDQGIEDVISEEMSVKLSDGSRYVNLTDEQALELEKNLEAPTIDRLDFWLLVKINVEATARFKELCDKNMRKQSYCYSYLALNEGRGLYVVDFFDWDAKDRQSLIDNNIVLGVAFWDIYINDEWKDEMQKSVFDGYPFFLYIQPYSSEQLTERAYEPRFPFKAEQLSDEARKMALKFPLRFKNSSQLQIAEYFQSGLYFDAMQHEDDGVRTVDWDCLPLSDGTQGLIRRSILGDLDCSKCFKCFTDDSCDYIRLHIRQNGLHPTILHLFGPEERDDFRRIPKPYDNILFRRPIGELVVSMPIIGGLPKPERKYYFGEEYLELVRSQDVNRWFGNCRENFEDGVSRLSPRVIVASEEVNHVIERVYAIVDNVIEIAGQKYPYFVMDQATDWTPEIIRLAQQPYRGETPQRIKHLDKNT